MPVLLGGLIVRKRKASSLNYGKDDFVFDKHFKAHKRSRGVIPGSLESVLSSAIKKDEITGYLDPKPDGNCGFRAIAFSVERNSTDYQDNDQYLQVRDKMLETFYKYKDIYVKNFPAFQIDRLETVIKKGIKKSDLAEWFYGPDCAQVTADAYGIPVCIYPSLEHEHAAINPPLTFLPLELPKLKTKPVAIHLQNSHNLHWYAIKLGVNQTNLPAVYHYYFNIEGKLNEYSNHWNRWRQFPKKTKTTSPITITIE